MNNPNEIELTPGDYYWVKRKDHTHGEPPFAVMLKLSPDGWFAACDTAGAVHSSRLAQLICRVRMEDNGADVDLPPHDPDRWACVDGFDDTAMTNGMRARSAADCIGYDRAEDDEAAIDDLIVNLLHLAHSVDLNPLVVLNSAKNHFLCEAGAMPEESQ